MRSTRRQGSHDRQRGILMAALDCFTTRGVSATTLEDIRAKSGASIGSIYHHFRSKENLAATLYVEGLRDYHAGLLSHYDGVVVRRRGSGQSSHIISRGSVGTRTGPDTCFRCGKLAS